MNPEFDPVLNREIFLALWKIHILHHAAEGEVVGRWMLGELHEHGYDVSPGTLYPILKRMERHGWLAGRSERNASPRAPRRYSITTSGREILRRIRLQLAELKAELG